MYVELKLQQVKSDELLLNYIERRLSFVLSRFSGRLGRITARIRTSDSGGPELMTCHITADLRPFGVISAEATEADVYTAIDRAAARLARRCESKCARPRSIRSSRKSIRTSRLFPAA